MLKIGVSERSNLKNFCGRIPPYKALAFGTQDNAPRYKRPTYGPDKLTSPINFMNLIGIYGYIFYGLTLLLTSKNVNNDVTMNLPIRLGDWHQPIPFTKPEPTLEATCHEMHFSGPPNYNFSQEKDSPNTRKG